MRASIDEQFERSSFGARPPVPPLLIPPSRRRELGLRESYGGSAEHALRGDPSDVPLRATAAGAPIRLRSAVDDMVAACRKATTEGFRSLEYGQFTQRMPPMSAKRLSVLTLKIRLPYGRAAVIKVNEASRGIQPAVSQTDVFPGPVRFQLSGPLAASVPLPPPRTRSIARRGRSERQVR